MSTTFLSSDDPFPITEGSDALFSPSAFGTTLIDPLSIDQHYGFRKRARPSLTPTTNPSFNQDSGSIGGGLDARELAAKLASDDPNDVVNGLNTLLKLSADHDLNYALGRHGELVVEQLVKLYDETIGWKHRDSELDRIEQTSDDEDEEDLSDLTPSTKTWECIASPSRVGSKSIHEFDWPTFCATKFAPTSLNTSMNPTHINPSNILSDKEHMKRLEVIIMIIRNLSFVQGNARFLTHTVGIMRILTGSLYFRNFTTPKAERAPKSERDEVDNTAGNSANNICFHSLHAISNLVPSIDTIGRRVYIDLYLLDGELDAAQTQTKASKHADSLDVKTLVNPKEYGRLNRFGLFGAINIAKNFNVKDETFNIPDSDIQPVVKKYVRASLTIFPPLVGLIGLTTSRAVVMAALDLLILLLDDEEKRPIFEFVPDEILYHLVRLLWKNRLGPDSLEYFDPMINMVPRVCSMKLVGTYDSAVDYELRDRAIDILEKLTAFSSDLKRRVGKKIISTPSKDYGINIATSTNVPNTKLYDAVIPAVTTKVGIAPTPLVAVKLLQNLASVPENVPGILYCQRKLIKVATSVDTTSSNEQISNILFKDVLSKIT